MSNARSGVLPLSAVVFLLAGCVGPLKVEPQDEPTPTLPHADAPVRPLDPSMLPPLVARFEPTRPTEPTPSEPTPTPSEPTPSEPSEPTPSEPSEPTPSEPTPSEPSEPTPSEPAPAPTDPLAALGPLPPEMAGLRWPDQPRITREVTVTSASEIAREAVSGTRIRVNGAVGGDVHIDADDVEIVADASTSLGRLSIGRSVSRVRVSGGQWTDIFISQPATYYPSVEYRAEWMVEDVTIENVTVRSSNMAFEIRGRRIAIAHSRVTATRYSVWLGDTGPMQSEDIILHDNVFDSSGPEATVRLVQVLRSATISNVLVNPNKHNYRIHGTSDLNYAADNMLVGSGVMLGRMPGDALGRVWFDDNVFHHTEPDLFNPDTGIAALHATNNLAYTNVWSCFYCSGPQAGWTLSGNSVAPYTPAPPY